MFPPSAWSIVGTIAERDVRTRAPRPSLPRRRHARAITAAAQRRGHAR